MSENIGKVQTAQDDKIFVLLQDNQAKLLAALDSFNLPSAASTRTARVLETVKKLVSVELLSCVKGARKSYKQHHQLPEQPKYLDEFTESLQFLLSTHNEIDKLIRLFCDALGNE